jgi:hypothetical protein
MKTARRSAGKSAARTTARKSAEPAKQRDLEPVFSALCGLLKPYQGELAPQADKPTYYCLESKTPTYKNRPMYFAGVRQGKNHVSYYLMSVYACPELVKGMSPGLRKRMQGKACFNFTSVDAGMIAELARLTEAGFQKFKNLKYL